MTSPTLHQKYQMLIEALDGTTGDLERLTKRVDDASALCQPAPDEWCVKDVIAHLADIEGRFRARFVRMIEQDNPREPFIYPDPASHDLTKSVAELIEAFRATRTVTTDYLRGLSHQQWLRTCTHETFGVTKLRQQVEILVGHDNEHLAQLVCIREFLDKTPDKPHTGDASKTLAAVPGETQTEVPAPVPVIDISPFLKGTSEDRHRIAQVVGQACQDIGFFSITGHGVPEGLISRMADISRCYFDLPLTEKMRIPVSSSGVGYVPLFQEALAASLGEKTPGDLKESFNVGRHFASYTWPENPPELRSTWIEYFTALNALGGAIMRMFAMALELPEGYFDDKINPPMAFLRAINYPSPLEPPQINQLRAGAHSDYGTLTILLSENKPGGLQVRSRAGRWLDVVSPPGSFVVNIGDMMQMWTNDKWLSTVHRVVNPPAAEQAHMDQGVRSDSRRQSLVFFHTPHENTLIECLPSCTSADNPPRHAPIRAADHMRQKSAKAGTLAQDT